MKSFREWLEVIDRNQSEYDPIVVDNLMQAYSGANGVDDSTVLEKAMQQAPREQAAAMRSYYGIWRADEEAQPPPTWPLPGEKDHQQRDIRRVYIATDLFVIYATDENDLRDLCGLHYQLAGSYARCQVLRGRLAELTPDITSITDAVCSIRPMFRRDASRALENYHLFRERICEMVAQAMSSAFEDRLIQARSIIAEARAIVQERRDSLNRMRYVAANTVAAAVILAIGLSLIFAGLGTPLVPNVTVGQTDMARIPVLMAGALGAFFSVSLSIRQLRVDRSITLAEMFYAGFVRVPIGVIAAAVVVWLIEGGWILGSVGDTFKSASVMLFAFIAGFSEMFVPNALNQVQDQTRARDPGAVPAPPPRAVDDAGP